MKIKEQYNKYSITIFLVFSIAVLLIVGAMEIKSTHDQQVILEDSVESQLISISIAARELIDVDEFMKYNTTEDMIANQDAYMKTRMDLRILAAETGAKYIYVLKQAPDGSGIFIFDTDVEDDEVFIEYELAEVHKQAFKGQKSAGTLNLVDEYGSYNTGAVPINKNGHVVGIVSADIEDTHIRRSRQQSIQNIAILLILLVSVMGLMLYRLRVLMNDIKKMHQKLEHDAKYDAVTGLPNRKYLMEYLETITGDNPEAPFALLFVDLDNFKRVNDTAGHDAGDALLRDIASYLERSTKHAKSFRPTAGPLNIAARVGGDEFIQVIQGVESEQEIMEIANHLLAGFQSPEFDHYVKKFQVGMSIGIALYPYHTKNFHVLIKYADIAMYHSKRAGKNMSSFYDEDMEAIPEK